METHVSRIDGYEAAVAFLDERIGRGVDLGLDRTRGVLGYLGDPQQNYSIVHVAGTNGKTTVTRMIDTILGAHGLRTGTFTSPHLSRVEQRFTVDGATLTPQRFVDAVGDIAWFVEEYERRNGEGPTYFELTALIALAALAEAAVDVAVLEVGLGGRYDATNVVDADVSVITGIAMDHQSVLGNSVAEIGAEKVAILKDGGTLVTGPLPAAADGVVTARVAETGSRWVRSGDDFGVDDAVVAVGGWRTDVRGLAADYDDLYLPLHGRHQVDNLVTAIAAAEVFVEHPLDASALRDAAAAMTSPGRIEVVDRRPLVIVDGAHNAQAFEALAETVAVEFPALDWQLVVGLRGHRKVDELLAPLVGLPVGAFATEPDDPAAIPVERLAEDMQSTLNLDVTRAPTVADAVAQAVAAAGTAGGVLVAGSLYVAGEARTIFVAEDAMPAGVHVRFEAPIDVEAEEADLDGSLPSGASFEECDGA